MQPGTPVATLINVHVLSPSLKSYGPVRTTVTMTLRMNENKAFSCAPLEA